MTREARDRLVRALDLGFSVAPSNFEEADFLRTELFMAVQRAAMSRGEEQAGHVSRAQRLLAALPIITSYFDREVERLRNEPHVHPEQQIAEMAAFLKPKGE